MKKTFILHEKTTGKSIEISCDEFSSMSEGKGMGTNVWWTDENEEKHSALVNESFEEVNEIMQKSLEKS